MHPFRIFIEQYTHVDPNDWAEITSAAKQIHIKTNTIILEEGDICRHLYFIEKGIFRSYYNIEGNETTKYFIAAPNLLTAQKSFRLQKPAQESLQALDNAVAYKISHDENKKLLQQKTWNNFTRLFMSNVQQLLEEQLMKTQTRTAEYRYLELQNNFPHLINKIPLMHMASFLGIAPQSLSRIRKKHQLT